VLDVGADGRLKKKKRVELDPEDIKRGRRPPAPLANEIYWYIDLRRFADVARWRCHRVREARRRRGTF